MDVMDQRHRKTRDCAASPADYDAVPDVSHELLPYVPRKSHELLANPFPIYLLVFESNSLFSYQELPHQKADHNDTNPFDKQYCDIDPAC